MPIQGPTNDHAEIRRWADAHGSIPAECLPYRVDHIPPLLRFLAKGKPATEREVRPISWADFFARFDALGLAFVYDEDAAGTYEFLQIEAKSPFRHPAYQVLQN